MVQSNAKTVTEYLKSLPPERRAVIAAVRKVIRANLPAGYVETMGYGMMGYVVPLKRYPNTYNGQPLPYVGMGAQKHFYAVYLNCVYMDPALMRELRAGFERAGKKLDMGKSCVRFKRLEDLSLDAIAKVVAATTVDEFIAQYEKARSGR